MVLPYVTKNEKLKISYYLNTISEPKMPYYVLNQIDPENDGVNIYASGNYDSIKTKVIRTKAALLEEYKEPNAAKDQVLERAGHLFTELLLNEVIPHWYGTKWDYNGYTDVPKEGRVACGYFVSTTLKHMGLNVNRYRLAQTYSLEAVEVLNCNKAISLSGQSQDSLVNYVESKEDGFYAIGLDSHIGFICKKNGVAYFIHSNSLWPGTVCLELARRTGHLRFSNSLVLANLSNNQEFIKKWVLNEEFIVTK